MFADPPPQLLQLGALRQLQRRLLAGVLESVLLHPIAQGGLAERILAGDLGDRPLALDDEFRCLLAELRGEFLVLRGLFRTSEDYFRARRVAIGDGPLSGRIGFA